MNHGSTREDNDCDVDQVLLMDPDKHVMLRQYESLNESDFAVVILFSVLLCAFRVFFVFWAYCMQVLNIQTCNTV